MDQQYGHVDELKIGGVVIRNWHFNAIDFKNVNNSFSKAQRGKIDGIVGADILRSFDAEIRYRDSELWLTPYPGKHPRECDEHAGPKEQVDGEQLDGEQLAGIE